MKYLSKYFTQDEMSRILKSQLYSSVYYNAEVWLHEGVHKKARNRLLSATTGLIRAAFGLQGWPLSREDIHELSGIPTPKSWSNYVHSRTLHRVISDEFPSEIYTELAKQALSDLRNQKLVFSANNNKRVGINCFQNRCRFISSKFKSNVWELDERSFKILNKKMFN
jgi:hypothetical protein